MEMPGAPKPLDFKDYEGLARFFTWKYKRRADARGLNITYDEIFSEICVSWCMCRDRFDPERSKFSTFWSAAVRNKWKDIVSHNTDRAILASFSISGANMDDSVFDEIGTSFDIEDESRMGPEACAIRSEQVSWIAERAPLFMALTKLASNPPQDLVDELKAVQAQYEYAQQLGVDMDHPPNQLTPSLMSIIFNFNWRRRLKLNQEMEETAAYV